jgi:flagellar biosynthesis/type III secretory pathway chaperone
MDGKDAKELQYFQITDLWRKLCEEHSLLFDQTCDEYAILLKSDLDLLEAKIAEKEETIARIGKLEKLRGEVVAQIRQSSGLPILTINDVIDHMGDLSFEREQKHLSRFNALLIDIIEKIQRQNKKNQMFINKAILALSELKSDALGKKNYSTYNAKGTTRPLAQG